MTVIDLTGQKFGRLTVIKRDENKGNRVRWLCKCDCGNQTSVASHNLRRGTTQSCGCMQRYNTSNANAKHRLSKHPLYHVWHNIKYRCQNPRSDHYYLYGERSIGICDEWDKSVVAFIEWGLSHGYQKGLQIDRIDNDKGYSPENCRFATRKENQNNRRQSRKVRVDDVVIPLADYARLLNKPRGTVWHMCKREKLFI